MVRRHCGDHTWSGIETLPYKEDGSLFKNITRQTLFKGEGDLPVEWRYFEVGPEGHSTLERHEHQHAVMVIRGHGRVFVGGEISKIGLYDIVHIPSLTWHQFRADSDSPLGFLCIVNNERDRPQRPTEDDLKSLLIDEPSREYLRV